jgi:hypothetical protein
MTDDPKIRARALRMEAARCLAQANVAVSPKLGRELIEMAARFNELASSTAAHDFGAILRSFNDDGMADHHVAQQQQQIQPKKEE